MVCQNDGDPEDLLLCDGCNLTCHTYCCGLHSVPEGSWFCEYCHEDGTANLHYDGARRRANTARLRQQLSGRTQRRAPRGRLGQSDYTRVWQSVLSRTNIDLDFPFEDDTGPSVEAIAHRQEMREWTRRFQIAERQGGAARFRETAGTVMQARNTQQASDPAAQSSEEVRAWGAFDRAREAQENSLNAEPTRGRKRKSATASPVEPDPPADAERRLKRPRTRRVQDVASSSRGVDTPTASTSQPPATPQGHTEPPPQGPSFLRQLLTEVEHNSSSTERGRSLFDRVTGHTPRTDASPGPASPTYSPSTSNHPSPRMRSASPQSPHSSRPSSPSPGLTSHIEPIYKPHNNSAFSPASPGSHAMGRLSVSSSSDDRFPRPNHRHGSQQLSGSEDEHEGMRRATQPKRSGEASPTRYIHLTFEDKSTLQKMVAGALKPFYHNNEIDTDQFTEINMNVSRKMYEKVEQAGGLKENSDASIWEAVAVAEVEAAVKKLRRSSSSAAADAVPAAPAVVA
ncbi:hypothetical protein FH972_026129 [Carpinus fangiana]|nr:hypothetical protein FH972_026129 [Carpinus fangiana]